MARFDWKRFLTQHRIEFVTSGPNYSRNNVCNITCPFCGQADSSQHMGLNARGWYGCLRNAGHRGRTPHRLIRQLLHCSAEEANRIVGGEAALAPAGDDLASSFASLKQSLGIREPASPGDLKLPPEFRSLLNGSALAQPFLGYLAARGYREAQIRWLVENYDLRYATKGDFARRLIIPIRDRYGDLLSWTGRTIVKDAQPRYKTLRVRSFDGGPVAKLASNHTILGLPTLWGAPNPRALVLVEGPFDALKLTAFGHALGVYAAALFGLNVYQEQVAEVLELAGRFERVYLLVDEDAELQRLRLTSALRPLSVRALKMPAGSDDPGAMSGGAVVNLCVGLTG